MYGRTWVRLCSSSRVIISAHHVALFLSRSSISEICLPWHSALGVRSPQIQTLSSVSVFSVSSQEGCLLFECSAGFSRIISKCTYRMWWRFHRRFICGSRTSIRYGSVHSWIPHWYECLIDPFTCRWPLILFLGPAVGPIAGASLFKHLVSNGYSSPLPVCVYPLLHDLNFNHVI